jgi:tetratricopeptide (TPR) repeat protein
MNAEQLLKQVWINRDLVLRQNENAPEHLEMLERDYAYAINAEVSIVLEMNKALIEVYFNGNYAKAMDISLAAIDKFGKYPYRNALAFHMKMVANSHMHLGQYDLAKRYLLEAIDTLSPNEDYVANKADMLYALAQNEESINPKSPQMAGYLQEALSLLEDVTDSTRKANCLMGLGNYFINVENPQEALRYFHEAVLTFEKKYLLHHMSNTYSNMGTCYLDLKDFERAEEYMQKALDLRLKTSSPDSLAISYGNFGVLYLRKGEYDKAEEFLNRSQKIAEEIGFKQLIDRNNDRLHDIGRIKAELKGVSKAA